MFSTTVRFFMLNKCDQNMNLDDGPPHKEFKLHPPEKAISLMCTIVPFMVSREERLPYATRNVGNALGATRGIQCSNSE